MALSCSLYEVTSAKGKVGQVIMWAQVHALIKRGKLASRCLFLTLFSAVRGVPPYQRPSGYCSLICVDGFPFLPDLEWKTVARPTSDTLQNLGSTSSSAASCTSSVSTVWGFSQVEVG